MYSSVNNRDTTTSILSIKEIIGIVLVFIFVLYLVFPKQNIEQIIQTKGKNRNLSINYLESILLYYPNNIKLELILLQNYYESNQRKKAFALIKKIRSQTKDKEVLDKVYRTEYEILKEIYFEKEDKRLLSKIKKKLYDYYEFKKGDRDYLYFLAEATQMGFDKLKYLSLKGLIKTNPELVNYKLKKEAFYLASSLGYSKDAQELLLELARDSQIDKDLKNGALSVLLSQKRYIDATNLAIELFRDAKDRVEKETYFNIALYATTLSSGGNGVEITQLIDLYKNSVEMDSHSIYFILDNLLKVGDIKGADRFGVESFKKYRDKLDKKSIELIINAMIYNQDLENAQKVALFGLNKFHTQKWLDKAIQLSLWRGDINQVVALNTKGYREYKDKKYEKYILKNIDLNHGNQILKEIYKQKIKNGDYRFVEKLAKYFAYTDNLIEGEEYFFNLSKRVRNKEALAQAILFAYRNNDYKRGLKLYSKYKKRFGIQTQLQQNSIKILMALKEFKRAYGFAKELKKRKNISTKTLFDLAWIYKDYRYLDSILWEKEKSGKLDIGSYSKLIRLNQELHKGDKLSYLYKKMWKKTKNITYIKGLLYLYSSKKEYKKFQNILDKLTPKEKKILNKDINYHILLSDYYIHTNQFKRAKESYKMAFKIDKYNTSLHQAYLWFLMDNRLKEELQKEIDFLKNHRKLRKDIGFPAIVGAMMTNQNRLALRWISPYKNKSKEYKELYIQLRDIENRKIQELISRYSPKAELFVDYIQLSDTILESMSGFKYQFNPYKNIIPTLSFTKYKYHIKNKRDIIDNSLSLNLKNSNNNLLWDITITKHKNNIDNYISNSFGLSYKIDNTMLKIISKHQEKTQHTTKLNIRGLEDSIQFIASENITNRLNLSLSYKEADFKLLRESSKLSIGELKQTQLISNYTLRIGYPDIIFGAYITDNRYSNRVDTYLPKDFIEFGGHLSIGSTSQNKIHKELRPFGEIGFAMNNHNSFGTRFSLGFSGELKGKDIFSFALNYSKEVNGVNKPFYGFDLKYRF